MTSTATIARSTEFEKNAPRHTASYLDFVAALRQFNGREVKPAVNRLYARGAGEFEAREQRPPRTLEDARSILEGSQEVRWWKRLGRSTQEMNWQGSFDSLSAYKDELETALREAANRGPGKLVLDPGYVYPDYIEDHEIHIQPGSYHGHPTSGYVYFFGVQVFHAGTIGNPLIHRQKVIDAAPLPPDGRVDKILDLACGIGITTEAWKRRFPNAEVWGTDIAAPMVSYAHLRGVETGMDVNYAQMPAEDLRFEDVSFDVVFVNILFHELPTDVSERVVQEAYRVLRPGGIFVIDDFRNAKDWTALDAYVRDYDAHDNGEPFSWDFCNWDLLGSLQRAGFREVHEELKEGILAERWAVK